MTFPLRARLAMAVAALLAVGFTAAGIKSAMSAETAPAADAPLSPEQEKFFEEKVRPVLAARCLECHGDKKAESGLRLDSRDAALAGGATGEKAVVPGNPDASLLVKAINHAGDIHMPPDDKLAAAEIEALTDWVRQGLPWPVSSQGAAPAMSPTERAAADRQGHWAFQPVADPALPEVQLPQSARGAVDRFVLARLDAAGIKSSPEADRRTLIRRAAIDLVGLPPSAEEVDAFLTDESPDAYERLIDRLLASPHYGERWGRHWLDVARYADTKGYAFANDRRYPYAYTYRDYVIASLNADLPYDQFILEQLAADKLQSAGAEGSISSDPAKLAALGFLTTGRKFNNVHDDLDDKIDATTRGLLGLTVSCARCHDHKYDAIPTDDYYSLYGVFASTSEPSDLPLIGPPEESAEYQKFQEELGKLQKELDDFVTTKYEEFLDQSRRQSADYLARVAAGTQNALAKLPFLSIDPKDLRPRMIQRWQTYLDQHAMPEHATLGLWSELVKLPNEGFAERAAPILAKWQTLPEGTDAGQINPRIKAAFAAESPAARVDVARLYGQLLTAAYEEWKAAGANEEALSKLPPETRQLAEVLVGKDSPPSIDKSDTRQYFDRAARNRQNELKKKVDAFQATSPVAPPRAMVVVDNPNPTEPRVLIRGNPGRPGKQVPRQYLLVLSEAERQPFTRGSGRLDLAEKIASPDNPLTRRVIANRVWMHHFGEPLVLTPSDFGIRCEPPTHPELLEWLASRMLDDDWSLKALHRRLMHSATYRQASADRPECRAVDPENRLWWRTHRRRLELEAMRDSLLALSGQLDERVFGRAVELTKAPYPTRRAVYGHIDRQDLPNLFRVFDIASPDSSTPRRPRTTVPQQALFLMNSPFVVEQAQVLAAQLPQGEGVDDGQRIAQLYRLILQRTPTAEEEAIGRGFVAGAQGDRSPASSSEDVPAAKLSPWEQYAQLLLLTNEVMYID
ncbi:MAG: PSD1 and planctomycete cytochrome C domain-containing protein [Pirellulaceae bacterium]|nr:PSD1 and planctomycete cytochrome C domain-containing protein [Pirellulaceae bacterium]